VESLAALLGRREGVITWHQALKYLTAKAIRHKVASARWAKLAHGVFLASPGRFGPRQRQWAAVLGAGADRHPDICLGGISALHIWGLRNVTPSAVHVLTSRQSKPAAGVVIHRTRVALQDIGHTRPPATMPGRSVVDAVAWARSDREAQLVIAACFQQSLVTYADVERAVVNRRTIHRRALLLATASDCAGGSHSLGELDLLVLCRESGLPEPTRQMRRLDRGGRARYLDASFDDWKVAIEVDGAHHVSVGQMWDDAERSNALEIDGYLVLRYPAWVVRTQGARVAAEIRAALRTRGWVPPATTR
jgi:hypothetical protein